MSGGHKSAGSTGTTRDPTRLDQGTAMTFRSDRRFQLWDYTVGHQQMLLRSPAGPDCPTNIDIGFVGVRYLGIPSSFDGVEIGEATPEDLATLPPGLRGKSDESEVHVLRSGGRRFVVVAVNYYVLENELDFFESSLEYFNDADLGRDRGRVLVKSGRRAAETAGGNGLRTSRAE
jgi:hypothetical protein